MNKETPGGFSENTPGGDFRTSRSESHIPT